MRKYTKILVYAFPILISILTYRSWLSGNIFSYSDWPYYQIDSLIANGHFSVWASWLNFGYFDNLTFWRKPIQILYRCLALIGSNKEYSDILLAFFPIIIINPIISTFTIYKLTKSKIGALVGSLFFNFNTYFLAINLQGHLYLTISSSIVFLCLYLFISYIKEKNLVPILIISLLSTLVGTIDFRNLYILFGLYILYIIYSLLISVKKINSKILKQVSFNLLVIIILVVLLNAFWLLMQLETTSLVNNSITNRAMIMGRFFDIKKSFSLFHPFWSGGEIIWFSENSISPYFMLIPMIACTSFLVNKSKMNLFFGIVSLIGIFLSKQSGYPFAHVYEFLFQNIPGFNAFREASKFYLFTVIGYSFLISSYIKYLLAKKKDNTSKYITFSKYFVTFMIIVIILSNTKPLINLSAQSLFSPVKKQDQYTAFNHQVLSKTKFSRVMWIPAESKRATYNSDHPKISLIDIIFTNWKFFRNNDNDVNFNSEQTIISLVESPYFKQVLDNSSIEYIAIPLDYKLNKLDSLIDKNVLLKKLNSLKYLDNHSNINTYGPNVYLNKSFKPHMYTTNVQETITKTIDYQKIFFLFKSSTKYDMTMPTKEKKFLNFSEAYHPDWKLKIGKFNWFQSLIQKDYYYPDKYHIESEIGLNSWKIDPQWLKDHGYADKNIEMTLYFAPQAWMNVGLIISGSTFAFILGAVGYTLFKDYVKKKK